MSQEARRRTVLRRGFGTHVNEGQRLAWVRLIELNLTQRQFGEPVDADSGLVNRWLFAEGRPGLTFLPGLFETYGIPIEAWSQPPRGRFPLTELEAYARAWRASRKSTGTDG